ncbi:ROK family transcriptional regulator [Streptomyces sp. CMB-StM0423]|uniref:ROK family transcriptional regulator n=1 Tax=Streptomyces sp. CMB-StM0423 TaxID=2059884 RepID=UPI000C7037C3|nr:ROK family protein [Streptomyces sp. CMB-StM0423]AUH44197.1 ROK family protein [Streptomyces sp. CMB-StM0423]
MSAPSPRTQQALRQRNLSLALRAVAAGGPLSRAAVAARIGMTRAGVAAVVDELLRAGLLVELGPGRPGTVGRPGSALALNDRGPCGLGAEIGVDHLAVCAVDLRGRVRARVAADAANRDHAPGPVLARLAGLIEEVVAEVRGEGLTPTGLTVAVPGLIARDESTVVRAPNLGWQGVGLGPLLPAAPPARVGNEANLGALAEQRLERTAAEPPGTGADGEPGPVEQPAAELPAGDGRSPGPGRNFLFVSAEIGIGAAVVMDGELLRGAHGFAGELGHVPVRPQGRPCACGGRGCLEQYAGEEAVLRASGIDPARARAEHPGPGARIAMLAARAADGDALVRTALREAGGALGIALAGAVNLLDPETVVLGGALAGLGPWVVPAVERELGRRLADPARTVRLTVSALGAEGPLLGAALSEVDAVMEAPGTVVAG